MLPRPLIPAPGTRLPVRPYETFVPSRGHVIAVRPNQTRGYRSTRWTANLLLADEHGNPVPQTGRRTVYGPTRAATVRQLRWYTAFLALHAAHPRLAHLVTAAAVRAPGRLAGPGRGHWALCFADGPCY